MFYLFSFNTDHRHLVLQYPKLDKKSTISTYLGPVGFGVFALQLAAPAVVVLKSLIAVQQLAVFDRFAWMLVVRVVQVVMMVLHHRASTFVLSLGPVRSGWRRGLCCCRGGVR